MPAQSNQAGPANGRVHVRRLDWPAVAGGAALAAAATAAYWRTLSVPLIFDDGPSISDNPTIRHLATSFWPQFDSTVSGRPILNVSLAANYAVSGTAVWSYHTLNLAILVLAGLTLFGIVRRTLAPRTGPAATPVAFCAAILWTLHPLLTESVTYVIQRAESLMGLFYLLTLYCFIRGADADGQSTGLWRGLSVASCLLGMATKEVMASAPLVVLLYDRTFLSGGFLEAWRRRSRYYAGLAATWPALALLVFSTHGRGGTAGFGSGVSSSSYALAQLPAIVHYLRLCFWPHPLVFDYGPAPSVRAGWIVFCALLVAGLVLATAWALVRRPAVGFLGAAFFAILAPSSSIVPVATETMAEHRMFLPLIPVVVLFVAAIHRWLGRATLPCCMVLAAGLLGATWQRNQAYRSEEEIWADTVTKLPSNARAHNNLGIEISKAPGRLGDAAVQFDYALRLEPGYIEARNNLANALNLLGRLPEAVSQYEEVLRLKPEDVEAHNNLGIALSSLGRKPEAIAQFEEALRLKPDYAKAHDNLGKALESLGRGAEAIAQFNEALRLNPGNADAHYNLGNALGSAGRMGEAAAQYEEALRLQPDFVEAHNNLGCDLQKVPGRLDEAIAHYKEAIRLRPGHVEAHYNLGSALQMIPGRMNEAIAQYKEAIRLKPDYVEARYNLGNALASQGRMPEAIAQYEEAIRLKPDYVAARCNLGIALKSLGRIPEAIAQYQQALRLSPDEPTVHLNLALALLKTPGGAGEAVAHLKEVVRLQPDNELAGQILSRINGGRK